MNDEVMPQQRMLDLLSGYWVTQMIAAFARLGIADALARGPLDVEALARVCEAAPAGLSRLLQAAVGQQLVSIDDDGRYRLTALGGTLRSGKLGTLRDYAITMGAPAHWQAWARLPEAVQTNAPVFGAAFGQDLWDYYAQHTDEAACFSRAMGELSQLVAMDLVNVYDCRELRHVVDVGGAQGVLLAAVLQRAAGASGVLFDRAEIVDAARSALPAILRGRVEFVAGDFFETVPAGGDLYLLKQILHDYDDTDCLRILRRLRAVIPTAARLLIIEMPLPDAGQASPAWLVDLNMLVLLGGRERSVPDYARLLSAAGFALRQTLPLRGGFALLEAVPV